MTKLYAYLTMFILLPMLMGFKSDDGLMWQVEKKGRIIYIVGVIHFVPEDMNEMPLHIGDKFQESQILVVESIERKNEGGKVDVNFDFEADQKSIKLLDELISLGVIPAADRSNLIRTSPHDLSLMVQPIVSKYRADKSIAEEPIPSYKVVYGFDYQFVMAALKKKNPLLALEPRIAPKLSWMHECNTNQYYQMILSSIQKYALDSSKRNVWGTDFLGQVKNSISGDEKFLLADMQSTNERDISAHLTAICNIIPRNKNWISKIQSILEETQPDEKIFMPIGYSHLLGKDNLLQLLEADGYKVTRLRSSEPQLQTK
jgi:uncharacterized protein YbaP (TraB family)